MILQGLALLHWLLCITAYPMGNYFYTSDEEWFASAKLEQVTSQESTVPKTLVFKRTLSPPPNSKNYIVKSISGIRSIAVGGDDARLSNSHESEACPVQYQNRIPGHAIKCHFYRTRFDQWKAFVVSAECKTVDYRYDDTFYSQVGVPAVAFNIANKVLRMWGARFFDIDLIQGADQATFLELNFSPAPVFFENTALSGIASFSAEVLTDWLGLD